MSNLKMPIMTFRAIGDRFFSRRGEAQRTIAYATTATFATDGVHVEYIIRHHGHAIGWLASDEIAIDNAGYGTPTTRARLNAILGSNDLPYYVAQRNGEQVLFSSTDHAPVVRNFRSGVFDLPTRSLTSSTSR